MIAAIKNENGAIVVADLYEEAASGEAILSINKVNLLEVYYGFRRESGLEFADTILKSILDSVVEVSDISLAVLKEAGRIKAEYARISLADSVALAEASTRSAFLVTADHHEMDAFEKVGVVNILWIR
jgi:predicted nucleic acid-binding protein